MLAEVEELIDSICTAHKEFSQRKAEIASHLECLAAEAAQRESTQLEELPELPEGPDEVVFRPSLPCISCHTVTACSVFTALQLSQHVFL